MTSLFKTHLLKEVDGFSLGVFRAIFGLFMVFEIGFFQKSDFVQMGILAPIGTFTYDFLGWVQPMSEGGMNGVMLLLMLCSICIALGLFFRPAAIIFTLGFSYLLFLGKGHYNNHFYLFCLIAFYLIFTHADRNFSVRKLKDNESRKVPLWNYQVFRLALFITYFYGGLAKLNGDWLSCQQPVRSLVDIKAGDTFLNSEFMIHLICYGGLAFDLFIGFLLLFKRSRLLALVGVLAFNLLNGLVLFSDIGIFPFVMICATIIFFDPDGKWMQKLKDAFVKRKLGQQKSSDYSYAKSGAALYFLIGFMCLQLLIPFRSFLLDNNTNWTGIGRKFSWRMKIQHREATEMKFMAVNKKSGEKAAMDKNALNTLVNTLQSRYMAENPVMVWQFAQYLNEKNKRERGSELELYARIKVKYNGREPQYIVNPDVDLVSADYDPLGNNDWIMPLTEVCK